MVPAEPLSPLTGRLTVVHAAAGYGKTTAVRTWLRNSPVRWIRGADLTDAEPVVAMGRQVTVVDDLHLTGASGSGKSTLVRCVNALEGVDRGEIVVDGEVVSGHGVDVDTLRRKVGIVFQSYNLFPHMTVLRNVTLAPVKVGGLRPAVARHRARALLARVGLADKADAYPDNLSGGQQQRVAIVRAMAMEPRVLLLDEIAAALDPELVGEVLAIVRELAEDGLTMLIATHEMGFARDVAS
jgi:polar amino acid transport system ATP-binding protein